MSYRSLKAKILGPKNRYKRVWTEEIKGGRRTIYIRCTGCYGIYELTNIEGSMSRQLSISRDGTILPCVICPHCSSHTLIRLVGYVKRRIPDVFGPSPLESL